MLDYGLPKFSLAFLVKSWLIYDIVLFSVRPMLKGEELTVKKSELLSPEGGPAKLHCVKLTCGLLEYAGYPPTQYVWQVGGPSQPASGDVKAIAQNSLVVKIFLIWSAVLNREKKT